MFYLLKMIPLKSLRSYWNGHFSETINAFLHWDIQTQKGEKKKKKLTIKSDGKREKYLISINLIRNSTKIINLKIKQKMYTKYV